MSKFIKGLVIGRWTLTSDPFIKENVRLVTCRCECGTVRDVRLCSLSGTTPRSQSCGCLNKEINTSRKQNLEIGTRFERLVTMGATFMKDGSAYVQVVCDCGNSREVRVHSLKKGITKSCGCLSAELTSERSALRVKHGKSEDTIYHVWRSMKARCSNPNNQAYDNYGARGITYDSRWESFTEFYNDMGDIPENCTLERVDVNGNYCKENCVWADQTQQCFNRRKFKNKTSKYFGVSYRSDCGKWRATLKKYGEKLLDKTFETEYQAARAYDDACFEHYGVRKNFPASADT